MSIAALESFGYKTAVKQAVQKSINQIAWKLGSYVAWKEFEKITGYSEDDILEFILPISESISEQLDFINNQTEYGYNVTSSALQKTGKAIENTAHSAKVGTLQGIQGSVRWVKGGVEYALGEEKAIVSIQDIQKAFFGQYDSDHDGQLSFKEYSEFQGSDRLSKMGFNYMDVDRDEYVSPKEYQFYIETMYQYTQI